MPRAAFIADAGQMGLKTTLPTNSWNAASLENCVGASSSHARALLKPARVSCSTVSSALAIEHARVSRAEVFASREHRLSGESDPTHENMDGHRYYMNQALYSIGSHRSNRGPLKADL